MKKLRKSRDWRRGKRRRQGTRKNRRKKKKKKTREKEETRNIRFRSRRFSNGMRNTIRKRKPRRTRRNKGRHREIKKNPFLGGWGGGKQVFSMFFGWCTPTRTCARRKEKR